MQHVDALSRLPSTELFMDVLYINQLIPSNLPLNFSIVAEQTSKDPVLSKVMEITRMGWPSHPTGLSDSVKCFFRLRNSLTIDQECLLFGSKVVVPSSLRSQVLDLLHDCHPGIVRMKMLARSCVWWPNIDSDIETKCSLCEPCSLHNAKRNHDFYVPWTPAKSPFERVHIDFYTFEGCNFLLFSEAFSKWLSINLMPACDAVNVIQVLETIFSIFDNPMKIVSDNGPPFTSQDFIQFCTSKDILLLHSPEYHPESNDQAESPIGHAKRTLRKLISDFKTKCNVIGELSTNQLLEIVIKFLSSVRNIPSTVTGKTPNELLFAFKPRTLLSNLHPSSKTVHVNNPFNSGDKVYIKYGKRVPVVKGTVIRPLGNSRYLVCVEGVMKTPHVNQLSFAPA